MTESHQVGPQRSQDHSLFSSEHVHTSSTDMRVTYPLSGDRVQTTPDYLSELLTALTERKRKYAINNTRSLEELK